MITASQSFRLIDNLHKAIILFDRSKSNEGCTSQLIWNDEYKQIRQHLYLALETAKRIEVKDSKD